MNAASSTGWNPRHSIAGSAPPASAHVARLATPVTSVLLINPVASIEIIDATPDATPALITPKRLVRQRDMYMHSVPLMNVDTITFIII